MHTVFAADSFFPVISWFFHLFHYRMEIHSQRTQTCWRNVIHQSDHLVSCILVKNNITADNSCEERLSQLARSRTLQQPWKYRIQNITQHSNSNTKIYILYTSSGGCPLWIIQHVGQCSWNLSKVFTSSSDTNETSFLSVVLQQKSQRQVSQNLDK